MRDMQRRQMGAGNKTLPEATVVMKKLRTPKANLVKVEFLVFLTAFSLMLLTIFGSCRRRHNCQKLRILLWAIYTLSSYLIIYTLGLMGEAPFRNELLPVWAIFLMIFFGSSDSYSAHSLEDCEQWKNYVWQYMIKITGVGILMANYGEKSPRVFLVLYPLYFMVLFTVSRRAASLRFASGYGQQTSTKLIADYMSYEHQSAKDDVDPRQMTGYNYVVRGEEAQRETPNYRKSLKITDRVVTIEKVWKCQGRLLRPGGEDKDSTLKDICLSFSLYQLLRLRFGGYSLPKQAHEKLWMLIQHGLLAEENGYERAFRVVEQELSFLFDSFYTKYPLIVQPRYWIVKVMELLLLLIGLPVSMGLYLTWYNSHIPQVEVQLVTIGGLSIDVLVTGLILILFTFAELAQFCFVAISDWTKVTLLCNYVLTNWLQENKRIEKLIGLICRTRFLGPWERKLRQYSLLESYDYTPQRWLCNRFTAVLFYYISDGQKQSAPVELSSEVKKAVFRSLMSNPEALKNGEASLKLNEVEHELSWACRLETQTQVILVWHIATSILEHMWPKSDLISNSNFRVATSLSKYLAYLVVFSPKLLPDHPYSSEYVFNEIIIETRRLLKGYKTIEERIRKLNEISKTRNDTGIVIIQGARLGQQLLDLENEPNFIWMVLAEFWAELMVYVAPSDNEKAHAEHLAMGGEFVTHLWALISHAGIKREPPVE